VKGGQTYRKVSPEIFTLKRHLHAVESHPHVTCREQRLCPVPCPSQQGIGASGQAEAVALAPTVSVPIDPLR
jgi:hypothetical protein